MLINYESMFKSEEKLNARSRKGTENKKSEKENATKNADEIVQLCGKMTIEGWGISLER